MIKRVDTIENFTALIREWYDRNYMGFRDKFEKAVGGVLSLPEEGFQKKSSFFQWKEASIDDLCGFFAAWYSWDPHMDTGLRYIEQFSWLYYNNPPGLEFITTDPGRLMTRIFVDLRGRRMSSRDSRSIAERWMDDLRGEMRDYIIPEGGYESFNDFFIRRLKDGGRPVSSPEDDSVVVSPADAVVNMIDDDLSLERPINIKTQKLNIRELLNNSSFAGHFQGGTAVSCILMPHVYHHYHSPVKGRVVEALEDVAGDYFGIEDFHDFLSRGNIGYGYDYSVFEHFRRGYLIIETGDYGYVAMIPIGLNTIGSVVFRKKFKRVDSSSPVEIEKGEEVGYFQYGGSLNILLFERGRFPSLRIPQGQVIGRLKKF